MEIMILKKEYEWVLKILNSSINIYQIKTSENLFNAFINKWDDEISDEKKITLFYEFKKNKLSKCDEIGFPTFQI